MGALNMKIYHVGYSYRKDLITEVKQQWFVHGNSEMADKFLDDKIKEEPSEAQNFIIANATYYSDLLKIVELGNSILQHEMFTCDHENTIPLDKWGNSFCEDCGQRLCHIDDVNLS